MYTFNPENKTEDIWPYNQPFFFIVNLAIGGSRPMLTIDLPQDFSVDYIEYTNK
jgi:hypothetical protein